MIGRLTAVALVASSLAAGAMVGASACGGDRFTTASDDGSAGSDVTTPLDATGGGDSAEDTVPGDEGDDGGDGSLDALGADGAPADVLAIPDVLEAAPPHCATSAFECIAPIPQGWSGPFEVYRGTNPPTSCSTNFVASYSGSQGVDAGPATCGCSCATGTGVQCSPVTVNLFVSSVLGAGGCTTLAHCTSVSLSGGQCAGGVNAPGQCSSLLGSTLLTISGSTADGGSCAPEPVTFLPPVGWASSTRACISSVALAQVDCPSGSVCAPKPAQPYQDTTLCIAQVGDVPCPATDYTNRSVSYGTTKDLRRCTDCTCGPVTGSSCTGFVDVSPASSASPCTAGSSARYTVPQTCAGGGSGTVTGVTEPGDFHASISPQPGTCTPNPPVPTGAAAPAVPTTFCCQ
ncbi:MAG: hypothetical protein ACRENE_00940 [Polyangiaceae bacterium]